MSKLSKHFKFRTRSSESDTSYIYTVDLRRAGVSLINKEGKQLGESYTVAEVQQYVRTGQWIIVEDLETCGVDAAGNIIEFGLEDIKDFMRVVVGGLPYIVFTNSRSTNLSVYATNGKSKPFKLDFAKVDEVYSQPEIGDVLSPNIFGKLRFRRANLTKLRALQAGVVAAEAALAEAKAALAVGK